MIDLQVDMRDFLNAPNGLLKQSLVVNERSDSDASQSPLGGRTVWKFNAMMQVGYLHINIVLYVSFRGNLICRMSLIYHSTWLEIK